MLFVETPRAAGAVGAARRVPRYDAAKETETYQLNGEQLTPVAGRAAPVSRTAEKVFHTRVEGSFARIVRHGDDPKSYTWEVVDGVWTAGRVERRPGHLVVDVGARRGLAELEVVGGA